MTNIDRIREAAARHGLNPYQIQFCLDVEMAGGFEGKDVLEVGGHLPEAFVREELKVRSWVALEDMEYWTDGTEVFADYVGYVQAEEPYYILDAKIEDLPESFFCRFDLIVSIAAFQHIHMLPSALDKMFEALRPGGRLMAIAGPIWSAPHGHILRLTKDALGRTFSFGQTPVSPWAHLLLSPSELYLDLCKKMDRPTASRIVYEIYTSPRVNRFFAEDYLRFLQMSLFGSRGRINSVVGFSAMEVPADVRALLASRYPDHKACGVSNLMIDLSRVL